MTSMREKRRVFFNGQLRLAPSFTEQVPMREQHRLHGLFCSLPAIYPQPDNKAQVVEAYPIHIGAFRSHIHEVQNLVGPPYRTRTQANVVRLAVLAQSFGDDPTRVSVIDQPGIRADRLHGMCDFQHGRDCAQGFHHSTRASGLLTYKPIF